MAEGHFDVDMLLVQADPSQDSKLVFRIHCTVSIASISQATSLTLDRA